MLDAANQTWHNYFVLDKFKIFDTLQLCYLTVCLQCFDTVGWAAGRASGL